MNRIQQAEDERILKKVSPNLLRAQGILKASRETIAAAKELRLIQQNTRSIVRELYEGLRQLCETIGWEQGYQFKTHDVIRTFLEDILHEPNIGNKFDTYRKIRNGINYYGDEVSLEIARQALSEIPLLISQLEKHREKK